MAVQATWDLCFSMSRKRACRFASLVFLVTPFALPSSGAAQSTGVQATDVQVLGHLLDSLRVAHGVPGLAFAAFDDQGVLFEHYSGVKSAGMDEPIGPETVFEAASISKPVFAYIVMDLVSDGVLSLDAPLTDWVSPLPEVAHDPRGTSLTARQLLSHQGGLPNWRTRLNLEASQLSELFGPADTLEFIHDPGTQFGYSGEGFVLLQRVVESVTGTSLDQLADERVFAPLGMNRSTFRFNAQAELDYSLGHNRQGQSDKWPLTAALSSSTLHASAGDLARFGAHLAESLRSPVYEELSTPQVHVGEEQGLVHEWGLGVGVLSGPNERYLYHGGNNVIFIADFIYAPHLNFGYALLTNSAIGSAVIADLEMAVFGRSLGR